MKREKKLTKREKKAMEAADRPQATGEEPHIHCIQCGRHIDPRELLSGHANYVRCAHGTKYASCHGCIEGSMARLREHDQSGNPVKITPAWH